MDPLIGFGILGVYGIVMIIMGAAINKKTGASSGEGFFLADRRASGPFVAASFIATFMWGADLLGVPETVYLTGISGVWMYGLPIVLGGFAIIPLAARLRKVLPDAMTYQEFFLHRLDAKNHIVYTGIGIYTMLLAAAIQLRAAGQIIGGMASIDPILVAAIITFIIFAYSVLSGIWASMSTDWIQVATTVILTVIFVPIMVSNAGGIDATYNTIASQANSESLLSLSSPSLDTLYVYMLPFLLGWGLWGVASMSVWQRAMSVRRDKISRTFVYGTIGWFSTIPLYGIVGLLSIALFPDLANPGDAGLMVYTNLLGGVAEIVFSLILLGLVMSTTDSSIVALSLLGTRDIYSRYVNPKITEEQTLKLGRAMIGLFSLLAFICAYIVWNVDFLTLLWINGIGMTAVFFPLVYCLFWEKTSSNAVFSTVILVVSVLIYMLNSGYDIPTTYLVGHSIAMILTPLLSLLWPSDFVFSQLEEVTTT